MEIMNNKGMRCEVIQSHHHQRIKEEGASTTIITKEGDNDGIGSIGVSHLTIYDTNSHRQCGVLGGNYSYLGGTMPYCGCFLAPLHGVYSC